MSKINSSSSISPEKLRLLNIRYELGLRGLTFADLASHLNVASNTVWKIAAGKASSNRIRKVLADTIEMDYVELWGKPPQRRGWKKGRPRKKGTPRK